jgi:hypothetical protein
MSCKMVVYKPQWRNRQTRHVQGVVGISPWGFKSLLRHQKALDSLLSGAFSFGILPFHTV